MQIKIEFAKPVETSSKSGKQFTNLKSSDGKWYNVWGDHTDKKGQTINITEPKQFGKSLWTSIDKDAPVNLIVQSQMEVIKSSSKLTMDKYKDFVLNMFDLVKEMEGLTDGQAALINTACIALTNGKIDIDGDEQEPPEEQDEEPPY